MSICNLKVDRIIIHQIYRKESDHIKPPEKGEQYLNFAPSAMADFEHRVIISLGEDSKAIEMQILDQGSDDLPTLIDNCINDSDYDFKESSYKIAYKLAQAQFDKGRGISGGIVVIFTGKQGYPQSEILGVLKAEIHSGYEKYIDPITKQISLNHIEELLLTPNSRLFKTVGFCKKQNFDPASKDLNDKWSVLIFDSQINQADGKVSAEYFYRKFAGCGYPETSARTTKLFFETTREFIQNLNIPTEKKYELFNALNTYLKVDKSPTIDPNDFAESYLDIDIRDSYKAHLTNNSLPVTAFTKDIKFIETKLKLHKVTFGNNVKLEADPHTFETDVIIKPYIEESEDGKNSQKWTQIIVKSELIVKK
ncbi:nucleoid-associated protein [Acinetobacter sp. YQ_14]|uniref:nucleoid-associated protein n=1 Tax=Acinetobacter sp. YQ_14 TaxID=3367236 RepID=UPI00370C5347